MLRVSSFWMQGTTPYYFFFDEDNSLLLTYIYNGRIASFFLIPVFTMCNWNLSLSTSVLLYILLGIESLTQCLKDQDPNICYLYHTVLVE